MKIGLTTYSLDNKDFREQLSSMLKNGITPDFIILHYGGSYKYLKGLKFARKIVRQQRLKSIFFFLSYRKNKPVSGTRFKLNEEDSKAVDHFLSSSKITNTKGINDSSTIQTIKHLGDAIIACNSGRLNGEVLEIPGVIFLNVHASWLPMYRGMNNVEWALWENNDIYATIHQISIGIDEGDILFQEKIETGNNLLKTVSDYREYCFFKSNELMGKAIRGYLDKKLFFSKQDAAKTPLMQYYVMHPILKQYLQRKLSGG
jgi:folate-dependent phosphoribosylglycinamide formyltransferase PurN